MDLFNEKINYDKNFVTNFTKCIGEYSFVLTDIPHEIKIKLLVHENDSRIYFKTNYNFKDPDAIDGYKKYYIANSRDEALELAIKNFTEPYSELVNMGKKPTFDWLELNKEY